MPRELQAHCPHCGKIRVYRATSAGRTMTCHHCGLFFTLPAPEGMSAFGKGTVGGCGAAGVLAVLLACGGLIRLVDGLRPSLTTSGTEAQHSNDHKPKMATQKQGEDAAKLAEQVEEAKRRADEAAKKKEEKRQAREAAQRKAEQEKKEKRAASYLRYAKKVVDDGQKEKAKERLQEIVRDLPQTEAAKEARHLLEELTP